MSDEKEEKRRKKMHKKMRKILLQAWEYEGSDPFKETGNPSLEDVGRRVEDEAYYHATNHRSGWEEFARDLGLVYAHHISRCVSPLVLCSYKVAEAPNVNMLALFHAPPLGESLLPIYVLFLTVVPLFVSLLPLATDQRNTPKQPRNT
jgi:hypothetical protein